MDSLDCRDKSYRPYSVSKVQILWVITRFQIVFALEVGVGGVYYARTDIDIRAINNLVACLIERISM